MATILIIDDEIAIATAFAMFFRHDGTHVVHEAHTGTEGIALHDRIRPDLVLLDVRLPDMTGFDVLSRIRGDESVVIMVTAYGDVTMAVEALHKGAENFLTKPVDLSHLEAAAARALEKGQLRRMNKYLAAQHGLGSAVVFGPSPAMRELAAQVAVLAGSDRTTALIVGPRGAGKGQVAELIHAQGPRKSKPFVQVNCATLTAESLDAELFGAEEPGADGPVVVRKGVFELADGGTLFLDEIGDLAPALQPKLLRVLEGKGFRRQGGAVEITPDVRVIAATSRDLSGEVAAGRFREDLYYRLAVMPVVLPPLRDRAREDIVELAANLLDGLSRSLPGAPTTLADDALDALLRYGWAGNIRELRNVLERAMLVARGQQRIELADLPRDVRGASGAEVTHHEPKSLSQVEKAHIDRTLRAHNQNRTHAARELGISRATLIKKIRDYDLSGRS
ncbi:MAG: sigma-54-dependent Fis family transcriptional regulator [Gemmatimonadaceae bacterium]|nr:sigma-54-dependent Fis family transcriptional regulator [Gemmatimonadaceae bacterium]